MRKFTPIFVLVLAMFFAKAQEERLTNLKFNPTLYNATKKFQPSGRSEKYLIDKGITIVTSTTLSLPFVDDFSRVRTRGYKWIQNHTTDTFQNVFGTCLAAEGVPTIEGRFMTDTAWYYSYDTITHAADSTPEPPIPFTFFGPATSGCFSQPPQTQYYWAEYYSYTYTVDTFGNVHADSVLVTNKPSDSIYYAPVIYFATGDSGTLWFDNYAYVNNTYPILPPTIGVATLDGLNEYGLAYDNSNQNTYGTADYLTSNPLDLSGYTGGDSIYLSFFFEGGGLGDYPDPQDSLIVEFKEIGGTWDSVWSTGGYASLSSVPNQFQQVMVYVPELPLFATYYHQSFQFRFRNLASLYGNNDHWHIDYVKLNAHRSAADTVIHDIAFVYDFPTILKNFTQMPADQFTGSADLADSVVLLVHNLDPNANSNPPATNFIKGAQELFPTPGTVAADVLQTFNAYAYSNLLIQPSSEYTIPADNTNDADSFVINSKLSINPNDVLALNDTVLHTQAMNHILAYDDGSAERAYGLFGVGLKKFGYEFDLNQPDTLAAFQVMYGQVSENVGTLVFNFEIWDSLKMNDYSFVDSPIYSIDNRTPIYVDSTNGFVTYKLDTPIVIPKKIYFGWVQTDERNLQIGYDLNSLLGRPHMYFYSNARWNPSTISPDGSPMIRLILSSDYYGWSTGVKDLTKDNSTLDIFPNPTSGLINLSGGRKNAVYEISVTNMVGQEVKHESSVTNNFSLDPLPNDIYIALARDKQTGKTYRNKVIKTSL